MKLYGESSAEVTSSSGHALANQAAGLRLADQQPRQVAERDAVRAWHPQLLAVYDPLMHKQQRFLHRPSVPSVQDVWPRKVCKAMYLPC